MNKQNFIFKNIIFTLPLILISIYFLLTGNFLSTLLTIIAILIWHPGFNKIFRRKDNAIIKKLIISFIILLIAFLVTDISLEKEHSDENLTSIEIITENKTIIPEKVYNSIKYSNQNYSLNNTFMDYDKNWIKEINFKDYFRVRSNDNNSLNSFIYTDNEPAKIEILLKNDCYDIKTYHGDPNFPQGPHYIEIENNVLNDNLYTEKGEFLNFNITVCVKKNTLHLTLGKDYSGENYSFDNSAGYSMLNTLAIKKTDTEKWYYFNFGEKQNNVSDKIIFMVNSFNENPDSCDATFLQNTKCQRDALMKEFQQINCKVVWALYQPCNHGCDNGACY
jgi:hypothetical protein